MACSQTYRLTLTSGSTTARIFPIPAHLVKSRVLRGRVAYNASVSDSKTLTMKLASVSIGTVTTASVASGTVIAYAPKTSSSAHKTVGTAASHALTVTPSDHGTSVTAEITLEWDEFARQ